MRHIRQRKPRKAENNGHDGRAEADFELPVYTFATILSCLALL